MQQLKHPWRRKYITLIAALMLFFFAAWSSLCYADDAKKPEKSKGGSRWALLVGVDDYAEAAKLNFCGADMLALRDRLVSSGFPEQQVIVLHDKAEQTKYRPVKSHIERQLDLLLKAVDKEDLVVVGFSGHGVHIRDKSYLCPTETRLDEPESMVPLDSVYQQLEHCPAALKLLLVDACRNDPRPGGQKGLLTEGTKQFAASLEQPPKGILMLTSCAPGQISMEDKDFGHGVFMHFLLEGLDGKADAEGKGRVSLLDLCKYANRETKTYVLSKFNGTQTPALKGDLNDDFEIWSGPNIVILLKKALLAAWHTTDLSERANRLALVAELQARSGDKDAAAATFAEALQSALAIAKDGDRSRVLAGIVSHQARSGFIDQAVTTGNLVKEGFPWQSMLEIGAALACMGETEAAKLAFAKELQFAKSTNLDQDAIESIANSQLRANCFEQASDTAELLGGHGNDEEDARKIIVLAKCAIMQARAGDRVGASATLAKAIAVASRLGGKLDWLSRVPIAAGALARAGDKEAAQQLFERCLRTARLQNMPFDKVRTLLRIAESQGYAGYNASALATLREALDTNRSEKSDYSKVDTLCTVARLQALAGDHDSSATTFQKASAMAVVISIDAERHLAKWKLSGEQAAAGDFTGALRTAESIKEDDTKYQTIEVIIFELWIQLRDARECESTLREASRIAHAMNDNNERSRVLQCISFAQAANGLSPELKRKFAHEGIMGMTSQACYPPQMTKRAIALAYAGSCQEAIDMAEDPKNWQIEFELYTGVIEALLKTHGSKPAASDEDVDWELEKWR